MSLWVQPIGRLHYLVESLSEPETPHTVDLERQDDDPYFCSCAKFNKNTHHYGRPCQHIRAAVLHATITHEL